MLNLLLKSFWFMLPAGFANMAPVLFKWLPFLGTPIDLNRKYRGKPIFGSHKTYRGFLVGVVFATLIVWFQMHFYEYTATISIIDYKRVNIVLLGFLFGFGALFGDLIKSFFKRRLNIISGISWPPFDQIDWIIGSLCLVSFYITIPWKILLTIFILFGLLHPIVNLIGYYMKIKKEKL